MLTSKLVITDTFSIIDNGKTTSNIFYIGADNNLKSLDASLKRIYSFLTAVQYIGKEGVKPGPGAGKRMICPPARYPDLFVGMQIPDL